MPPLDPFQPTTAHISPLPRTRLRVREVLPDLSHDANARASCTKPVMSTLRGLTPCEFKNALLARA